MVTPNEALEGGMVRPVVISIRIVLINVKQNGEFPHHEWPLLTKHWHFRLLTLPKHSRFTKQSLLCPAAPAATPGHWVAEDRRHCGAFSGSFVHGPTSQPDLSAFPHYWVSDLIFEAK